MTVHGYYGYIKLRGSWSDDCIGEKPLFTKCCWHFLYTLLRSICALSPLLSISLLQSSLHTHTHTHIYIYIIKDLYWYSILLLEKISKTVWKFKWMFHKWCSVIRINFLPQANSCGSRERNMFLFLKLYLI